MIRWTGFIACLLLCIGAEAQVSYEKRLEIELQDGYQNEKIHTFEGYGLLLSAEATDPASDWLTWKYDLYNTDLEKVKSATVKVSAYFRMEQQVTSEHHIHTLFHRKNHFVISSIDVNTMEEHKVSGKLPHGKELYNMSVAGDKAYFEMQFISKRYLLIVNWITGELKEIPIKIPKVNSGFNIKGFHVLEETGEAFVFAGIESSTPTYDTYVLRISAEGEIAEIYSLSQMLGKQLNKSSVSYLGEGHYAFAGTYYTQSKVTSEGLFFATVKNGQIEHKVTRAFGEIKDFTEYMPSSKKEKIEKKMEKRESKGEEYEISYSAVPHDMVSLSDGYLLLMEAFYPTFRQEQYMSTSTINGVSATRPTTRNVFDGFQYTHAVLMKFDLNGQFAWEHTFRMWPFYKPSYVRRFISMRGFMTEQGEKSIRMVFSSYDKIISYTVDDQGQSVGKRLESSIETGFPGDYKMTLPYSSLNYWYDNYFIAYGSQRIKNKGDEEVSKKRSVFFITKIGFE
ncbi:MAG: hypothetical protein EAZ89_00935 [Bacteroidetes bacterium]|nr:MAG: hypothetical protein EAZ89_00935 [Bacteroidota bacterium]